LAIEIVIVNASALFLISAAGGDLLRRPHIGPYNFATVYPVVRFAVLLPVPD
jgi:hypothetical protein